ncbi:UNVERIFIED_CONTAM: hypothetical protein Sindi_1707900 [Sesamum indicum]
MWPNGYYFQSQVFYSWKWTRDMENTFVQALMDLKKVGIFRVAANNMHAVHSAIYDVNKSYTSRITYSWGYNCLDKLRERHYMFQWKSPRCFLESRRAQINSRRRREMKLARCYINAYEPLWDELCELFDDDENKTIWIGDDEEDTDDPFSANPSALFKDLYGSNTDADSALANPLPTPVSSPKHDGGSSPKSSAPDEAPSES